MEPPSLRGDIFINLRILFSKSYAIVQERKNSTEIFDEIHPFNNSHCALMDFNVFWNQLV